MISKGQTNRFRLASISLLFVVSGFGASGSGVGVADLGGGDSIVNAGGVLWWPGK